MHLLPILILKYELSILLYILNVFAKINYYFYIITVHNPLCGTNNFVRMSKKKENSTNAINAKCIEDTSNSTFAICKIGGRWKGIILSTLYKGKLRYSEIKRKIPGITERMLTLQLRELEKDLLIKRTVYPEVPPRVDYELTDIAKELIPVWNALDEWGTKLKKLSK